MAKSTSNGTRPYSDMTLEELRAATREFDKPVDPKRLKPLSAKERARFERARRGADYSVYIRASNKRRVTISVDERLLRRCEVLAKSSHLTRDQVIERSLAASLAFTASLPKAG